MSGKVGTWTYWFKSPDGFDITFANNKKDIPKGYPYVQHFFVEWANGKDQELIVNGKVVWIKKNTHKLTQCEKLNLGYEVQREIHRLLDVSYPEKDYKKVFKKKALKIKPCKIE
jgi:hypothetical protein